MCAVFEWSIHRNEGKKDVNILAGPDIEYTDEMLRSKCLLTPLSLLFRSRYIQLDSSVLPLHKHNHVRATALVRCHCYSHHAPTVSDSIVLRTRLAVVASACKFSHLAINPQFPNWALSMCEAHLRVALREPFK